MAEDKHSKEGVHEDGLTIGGHQASTSTTPHHSTSDGGHHHDRHSSSGKHHHHHHHSSSDSSHHHHRHSSSANHHHRPGTRDDSMEWKQRVRESRSQPSTAPGAEHVSSADHRGSRKSSKLDRHHKFPDSKQHSKRMIRPSNAKGADFRAPPRPSGQQARSNDATALEATTAPEVDEIEAALQRGRQQGREEERNARQTEQAKNALVPKASTATSEENDADRSRKGFGLRKYICGALTAAALIGAGVAAWLLLSGRPTNNPAVTNVSGYDPPTDEACLAISNGLNAQGQKKMTAKTFGVDATFEVGSDFDPEFLRKELEAKMRRDLLPLLAGCAVEGSIVVLENNNFVVGNSALTTVSIGDSETCTSNPEELCSPVYFEFDVFLKDRDVPNEELMILLNDIFQDQDLLEYLNLESSVEHIAFDLVFEVTPSSPTPSPSMLEDDPLDGGSAVESINCEAIEQGDAVEGQDSLASQEYDILLDVMLETATDDLTLVTKELEEKLQSMLMPSLAGCANQDHSNSFIINALVDSTAVTEEVYCLPDSKSPCYRFVVHMDIYMESLLSSADFSPFIDEEFRRSPLVERLELLSPFEEITVVDIFGETATANPSIPPTGMPSVNPTRAPVTYPTTSDPTRSPTEAPSASPTTSAPTKSPTPAPTKTSTPIGTSQPVLAPTLEPTPSPTPLPTPRPSAMPSANPSHRPTPGPSLAPSKLPSSQPSMHPSMQPSSFPSSAPSRIPSFQPSSPRTCFQSNDELKTAADNWFDSGLKASVEAQYGSIGDWCFDAAVNSMNKLFYNRGTFNEDISNWDVSGITDMYWMFRGANVFNQDIGGWVVSSVTRMDCMFLYAYDFNQDIGRWDVSSVTNFYEMFYMATSFNQDIGRWNVSSATNMYSMFWGTSNFNHNIGNWTVSSVTRMDRMFSKATSFNQPIGNWDVSSVTRTDSMFNQATSFNQDLSSWDLSSVNDMESMFNDASAFNQDLCEWGTRISSASASRAFVDTSCPTTATPVFTANPKGPFCHVC